MKERLNEDGKYRFKSVWYYQEPTEVVYNPSYEMLFEEETKETLEGYEKGQVSELGAVNVMTGIYTGRSPKDKYIVMDENSKDTRLVDLRRVQKRQPSGKQRGMGSC